MTNEELTMAIQGGQADLMEPLWKQNERFVYGMAIAWKRAFQNKSYFDVEDLVQQGWFALMNTVKYYDPDREDSSFMTLFKMCLKRQFQIVIGISTSKRDAAFFASLSLDTPLIDDEPDGKRLMDTIPDPASNAPFEALEDESEREQIRSTMDKVAGEILTEQQREIYDSLLMELRCSDIAANDGVSRARVQYHKDQTLEALRDDPRILQLWLDLTDQRETVGDIADRFMAQVGTGCFNETGMSSVERAVMRIIKNEDNTRKKQVELKKALAEKLHAAGDVMTREKKKRQRKQIFSDLADFERGRSECLAAR